MELNAIKKSLEDALMEKRGSMMHAKLSSLNDTDRIDPTLRLPPEARGHLHLIPEFIRNVEEVFGRMGFDVARGNEVESEDYNFFKLNFEKDHAALDMQATFWVKDNPGHVLRTHTSPVQIHYMETHKPPMRMICPGKVYRRDSDATHSPMFHQFEGLMVGDNVSLSNMKAIMSAAMRELIDPNIEFRFRSSYFPFVEPGLEVDMRFASGGRWLEVVGCGLIHPNVLKNVGIDPKKYGGFAFGFGVERLIMIKHGITDLRSLYEGDVRFLSQF
jgi:phenylalanyl-tRNA synthetase alpha chain